ncbi:MAG: class I SAM-dependent methyltransferase [Firmicutes bacterium]|nr:class I SAM-dependent methyltransferase [Bacillota bacterium]
MAKTIDFDLVADIYDIYVNVGFDVDFYLRELGSRGWRVLELMCGTGRVSMPLIESGIELTCLDYASKMVGRLEEKLRQRGLSAETVVADARSFDLGRVFDSVFIPFNSFMELPGRESQVRTLECIHRHLKPGGLFICTLHNPAVRLKRVTGQYSLMVEHDLPDGGKLSVFVVERYSKEDGMVSGAQFFEVYDGRGGLSHKRRLEIRFEVIERERFEEMIGQTGFRVTRLYGDYDRSGFSPEESPYMIYFLSRY